MKRQISQLDYGLEGRGPCPRRINRSGLAGHLLSTKENASTSILSRGLRGSSQAVLCQAFEIAADRFGSHRASLLDSVPFGGEPGQRRAGYDMVGMDHR